MNTTPLSVLLIEDSPRIRQTLTESVDGTGVFRVAGHADCAADAIALLRASSFAAVIVDLQLRRSSGTEVLEYLQRAGLTESMLVMVLTNHALAAYRERCAAYGVRHFLDKSLEFDRVPVLLEAYAARRS